MNIFHWAKCNIATHRDTSGSSSIPHRFTLGQGQVAKQLVPQPLTWWLESVETQVIYKVSKERSAEFQNKEIKHEKWEEREKP